MVAGTPNRLSTSLANSNQSAPPRNHPTAQGGGGANGGLTILYQSFENAYFSPAPAGHGGCNPTFLPTPVVTQRSPSGTQHVQAMAVNDGEINNLWPFGKLSSPKMAKRLLRFSTTCWISFREWLIPKPLLQSILVMALGASPS